MDIAIIGAGYAGLSACWQVLQRHPAATVTVFCDRPLGDSASGAAAGLLHCHAGLRCRLNWQGAEALAAARGQLEQVQDATGLECFRQVPILRVPVSAEQEEFFREAAEKHSRVEWVDAAAIQQLDPHVEASGGVLIHGGGVVDAQRYLQALWTACEKQGAIWRDEKVEALAQLGEYDRVIVAAGIDSCGIRGLEPLPLRPVKGQSLELKLSGREKLQLPLSAGKYLVPVEEGHTVIAGATFEKNSPNRAPDQAIAEAAILPAFQTAYPPLAEAKVTACRAGVRASTPGHLPLVEQIDPKTWVFSGLGSKGLLYHALLAEQVAAAAVYPDPT